MTDFLNDWGLTLVTFLPVVGAVLVMALPKGDEGLIKGAALLNSLAAAVVGMHAGTTDYDHARAQMLQAGQVELVFRIVAADSARIVRRQDAVGAHHGAGVLVTHDEVFAIRVENVLIDARLARRQSGSEFAGKDVVTQFLCFKYFPLASGEADRQIAACRLLVLTCIGLAGCHGLSPCCVVVLGADFRKTPLQRDCATVKFLCDVNVSSWSSLLLRGLR